MLFDTSSISFLNWAFSLLGDFLEVELLLQNPDQKSCSKGEVLVRKTIEKMGITEKLLEPEYYTDLIKK